MQGGDHVDHLVSRGGGGGREGGKSIKSVKIEINGNHLKQYADMFVTEIIYDNVDALCFVIMYAIDWIIKYYLKQTKNQSINRTFGFGIGS